MIAMSCRHRYFAFFMCSEISVCVLVGGFVSFGVCFCVGVYGIAAQLSMMYLCIGLLIVVCMFAVSSLMWNGCGAG